MSDSPEISAQKPARPSDEEIVRQASVHARRMLSDGRSRREILSRLAAAGEAITGPGCSVSIRVLDERGSLPIKSATGAVLGTFGTYFRDRRSPTPEEQAGVKALAAEAAPVLDPGRSNLLGAAR